MTTNATIERCHQRTSECRKHGAHEQAQLWENIRLALLAGERADSMFSVYELIDSMARNTFAVLAEEGQCPACERKLVKAYGMRFCPTASLFCERGCYDGEVPSAFDAYDDFVCCDLPDVIQDFHLVLTYGEIEELFGEWNDRDLADEVVEFGSVDQAAKKNVEWLRKVHSVEVPEEAMASWIASRCEPFLEESDNLLSLWVHALRCGLRNAGLKIDESAAAVRARHLVGMEE